MLLQERRAGVWRTVERARTRSVYPDRELDWAPDRAGEHVLRLVAPAAPNRPRLRRAVSPVKRVYGSVEGAPTPVSGQRSPLPRAEQGRPYAAPLSARPDEGLSWSIARGRLPAGLELDPAGLISGAPTARERSRRVLWLRAVDAQGRSSWFLRTLVTRGTPAPVLTTALSDLRVGQPWVDQVRTNGPRAGTWSVRRGSLPAGLELDTDTGVVSGTATTPGTSTLRLRFEEVTGRVAARDLTITAVDDAGVAWTSLRSDGYATCGIQADASGWCWGANRRGSVGDGTLEPRLHPYRLPGRWSSLDTRGYTSCGIRASGAAFCWGANSVGTVGSGSTEDVVPTPARLSGRWSELAFIEGASSGTFATVCGLRTDDTLWCWGYDRTAQSGDGRGGRDDLRRTPNQVPGTWQGLPVGTGGTRCALDTEDRAWCWGANQTGQVGNGRTADFYGGEPPTMLPGTWSSVVTGGAEPYGGTTCGVRLDGSGWCWGENDTGQVGDGTRQDALTPVQLPGAWTTITPPLEAGAPTCGLRPDDTAACWGANFAGAVGNGTRDDQLTPDELPGTWAEVTAAGSQVCGLGLDGSGWCWGYNDNGSVGDGTRNPRLTPYRLDGEWTALATANYYGATTCGVQTDGSGWCWGDARKGRTGTGAPDPSTFDTGRVLEPTRVAGSWATIDRSRPSSTVCGLGLDGSGWCWGSDELGAVGNGTLLDQLVPYAVVGGVG